MTELHHIEGQARIPFAEQFKRFFHPVFDATAFGEMFYDDIVRNGYLELPGDGKGKINIITMKSFKGDVVEAKIKSDLAACAKPEAINANHFLQTLRTTVAVQNIGFLPALIALHIIRKHRFF